MKRQENPLRNQKGFTLIEIIAVLVILGILSAVAVPKYMDLQEEARNKSAQAAVAEVKARLSNAYGQYLLKNNGSAPANIPAICASLADANTLPLTAIGAVNVGADYTVTLAANGTITVSVVQTKTLATAVTGTWVMPS